MTVSTRSMVHYPRRVEPSWPAAVAAAGAALFLTGVIGHPNAPVLVHVVALAALMACAMQPLGKLWRAHGEEGMWGRELEVASLSLVAALVLVHALPFEPTHAYPLLYLVVAMLVSRISGKVGGAIVAAAVVLVGARFVLTSSLVWGPTAHEPSLSATITHAVFIVCFGALAWAVHGAEALDRRRRQKADLEHQREHMLREAREFRLLHSGRVWDAAANRERTQTLILTDAVEAVHHTTYVSLCLLKRALSCHTCVLLWYDSRGEHLTIKELVSDSDHIVEGVIDPARGAIGGITRRREVVQLSDLRTTYRGLTYYLEPAGVRHFLGVPILEQGHLRGVLCVDRIDQPAFGAQDVDVLEEAAAYILRAVQNERLFASIEKSKHEIGRFFDASRRLGSVLTPEDVAREAISALAEMVPLDLAALTIYDAEADTHTVIDAFGQDALGADLESWRGRVVPGNQALVSMVVRNKHYLPFAGQVRGGAPAVLTPDEPLSRVHSLLVLPLMTQDTVLGTLVVGHRDEHQYGQERREILEVVSALVAVRLHNANLYAQMERMATRDALTGLANRRTLMQRLDEAMARHRRTNRPFCVVLNDIDHFKHVNDTYGHPVGDEVLRQVAEQFRQTLRETDFPARYGGEEFVVVLEDTDLEGAMILANRLREAVGALTFSSDKGPFQCTISMGVAEWPEDALERDDLIELADQALYASKKGGRNRVTAWRQSP